MKHQMTALLQWVMVLLVLIATIGLAVSNNNTDIIYNLCTLCFGYYFGSSQSNPPPDLHA